MKKTFTYSAFLFAMLLATALVSNAQSSNAAAKQETTQQQVAQPEAFFQAETLGAEFRHLRRMYMVALQKEASNYPNNTEIGAKIHSEMLKTDKDMR